MARRPRQRYGAGPLAGASERALTISVERIGDEEAEPYLRLLTTVAVPVAVVVCPAESLIVTTTVKVPGWR